ncbi:MAG: hypothetical protein CVU81_03570 [Euryarchaeota archaeon HGW-Euryarchaeota-1]|nr:MAG: hypothetical protein CVU81_03570 [Euryarchaeota archaeon HGW-Euryarchaeota-1]
MSHRDAETYLNVLQATHIISLVLPFYKNLTTELKKNPKLYFLDLGIRNAVLNNFSPFDNRSDRGTLSENFVFRQLVSSYDFKINFWRTTGKAEVDFILTKGDKVIPVEVKLTKGNLGKSFHSFLDAYNPKRALVVTLNEFGQKKVKNTIVYFVPIYYF